MTRFYDTPTGQLDQFKRNLADVGHMTAEEVAAVNGRPELALVMLGALRDAIPLKNRFDRYRDLRISPIDWIAQLRDYNRLYWDNRFTEEDFAQAEAQLLAAIPIGHVQSVNNLFGFHVAFSSLEETFEMWYKVYQGELPGACRWPELKVDAEHLGLHESARSYEPGIHLVNIDLVAHWEPGDGRTLIQVREQAKSNGEILAQLEVISIYGVLTELFMQQDGENLPYSDMSGTDVKVPGDSGPCALCVDWDRHDRKAEFGADWVDDRNQSWAAPVLREL